MSMHILSDKVKSDIFYEKKAFTLEATNNMNHFGT